jgi:hypothetical protein
MTERLATGFVEMLTEHAHRHRWIVYGTLPTSVGEAEEVRVGVRPEGASDTVSHVELVLRPRELDLVTADRHQGSLAFLDGRLVLKGYLQAVHAFLPVITSLRIGEPRVFPGTPMASQEVCLFPGYRRFPMPLDQARGFPEMITADLIDQVLVLSLILVGLPEDARARALDQLWASHEAGGVSSEGIARLLISILDLAIGNSDHANHRAVTRAARGATNLETCDTGPFR